MIYVMTISSLALVVLAIFGVASAWILARLMDRANDRALFRHTRWGQALERIEDEPNAAAIYYGARWAGVCLLIGMLFSRAV